jgi:hypothetical protein
MKLIMFYLLLVFNYDPSRHNVFKVNGTQFQSCTFPPSNEALSTGKDTIQLKSEGKKWYVCGIGNHCSARQMKFVITVLPESAPTPSPPPSSAAHSIVSSVVGVVMITMVGIAAIFV